MIKINKKLSYILVSLILILVVIAGNNALTSKGKTEGSKDSKEVVSIFLDDKLLEFSKNPTIEDEKVYVPIEEFAEKLGIEVEFKQSEKIILKKDDKNLVINTKDSTAIAEDNSNFFINSIDKGKKAMLPLDIISEHFGFELSAPSENAIRIYNSSYKEGQAQAAEEEQEEEKEQEETTPPAVTAVEEEPVDPEADKKVAYLTFDDGPNINTNGILDILKEKNVKATFFLLGSSIIEHNEETKRIHDEGHAIGVHSMTHNFNSVYASPDSFIHEMTITNDLIEGIVGKGTLLLRAPYGSKPYMKEEFRDMATSWGYRIWDWNIDSKDSLKKNTSADEVYNEVATQVPGHTKPVILFHDKEHTLEALPRIIDFLHSNGYEIEKIDSEMQPLNFWNDFR